MSETRHERIRQLAHKLWELAGKPEGFAQMHWLQAEKEVDKAEKPVAKKPAKPKAAPKKAATAASEKKKSTPKPAKTTKPKAKG